MTSKAVQEYFYALDRLKSNQPIRLSKGTPINRDTVALEAGRTRGSIRLRPGLERLIEAIESASKESFKQRRKRVSEGDLASKLAEVQELKRENEILKSRYMSLLYINYQLSCELRTLGGAPPAVGNVVEIEVRESIRKNN